MWYISLYGGPEHSGNQNPPSLFWRMTLESPVTMAVPWGAVVAE